MRDGATVSEVASATGLPRTTANRILETLTQSEYVARDHDDGRFRPTALVRCLSDGFEDESWLRQIAAPLIEKLAQEVVWPLVLTVPSGLNMVVRLTTDKVSPLALERYVPGLKLPILGCASGLIYLANAPHQQVESLLNVLYEIDTDDGPIVSREDITHRLSSIKRSGYAIFSISGDRESTISVPIRIQSGFVAALSLRHMMAALSPEAAAEKFLPSLQSTANRIAQNIA